MNRRRIKFNTTKYLVITAMLATAMQVAQAADIKLNVADGNWTNAASWDPAQVPVAADNVQINFDRILRITDDVACNYFNVANYNQTAIGTVYLESGSLTANNYFDLGVWGDGIFIQSAGTVTCGRIFFAHNHVTATGHYTINGGEMQVSGAFELGVNGTGVVTQTGGEINIASGQILYIAGGATSVGSYEMSGGKLTGRQIIGSVGIGSFVQTGGTNNVIGGFAVGQNAGSTGTYKLLDGTISASENLSVGNNGTGIFLFGDENRSDGEIIGSKRLFVGSGSGTGVFRGWGTVGLTGNIFLNAKGKIIADGYGTDRDLDLSGMDKTIRHDNVNTTNSGWYAQNHGKLKLPGINTVSGTYYWGENSNLDLVNSAKLELDTFAATYLYGDLLASDHSDVDPLLRPIGVWDFSYATPANLNSVTITFRYDETAVAALGITESELKVLHKNGNKWDDVTASIDTGNHTITTTSETTLGQFAVGLAPLPKGTVVSIR